MPWGIAVDDDGRSMLPTGATTVSRNSARTAIFSAMLGTSGSADGQFNRPTGVTVDTHGDIYVADWGNNRCSYSRQKGATCKQFLGDATLSKCARAYVLAIRNRYACARWPTWSRKKLFHGPVSCVSTRSVGCSGRLRTTSHPDLSKRRLSAEPHQISTVAPLPRCRLRRNAHRMGERNAMKIPISRHYCRRWLAARTFVKVETARGITGWGEV